MGGNGLSAIFKMSNRSGYINYISFVAGSNKGNTEQGRVFNDPFHLGDVDVNYTSSKVTKDYDCTEETAEFSMDWSPVVKGTINITAGDTKYVDNGEGVLIEVPDGGTVARMSTLVQPVDSSTAYDMDTRFEGVEPTVTTVVRDADGNIVTEPAGSVDYDAGTITLNDGVTGEVNVSYAYNNVIIPQNDLPVLNAQMKMMPLLAKSRRIAIYYF